HHASSQAAKAAASSTGPCARSMPDENQPPSFGGAIHCPDADVERRDGERRDGELLWRNRRTPSSPARATAALSRGRADEGVRPSKGKVLYVIEERRESELLETGARPADVVRR